MKSSFNHIQSVQVDFVSYLQTGDSGNCGHNKDMKEEKSTRAGTVFSVLFSIFRYLRRMHKISPLNRSLHLSNANCQCIHLTVRFLILWSATLVHSAQLKINVKLLRIDCFRTSPSKMDDSRAVSCCVCQNLSNKFHANISLLQSKHTNKSVSSVLRLILNDELASDWSVSGPICNECVDKINDYDEASEKMQSIERELKEIHRQVSMKLESDFGTFVASAISDDNDFDADGMDDHGSDKADDSSNEPLSNKVQHEKSENFENLSNVEEDLVKREAVDEPDAGGESTETKKSEFYCEECGKNLQTYRGLTVRWHRPASITLSILTVLLFIQIHMTKMHPTAVGFECSVCHTSLPNKLLLEVRSFK